LFFEYVIFRSIDMNPVAIKKRILPLLGLWILLAPVSAFAFSPNPTLTSIPANTALSLGRYNPVGDFPCGGETIISYSRFNYDSVNNQMLMWGGGHAGTARDDVDVLDLNNPALQWQSAYPTTPLSAMRPSNYDQLHRSWISTGHPVSAHSYDHMVFAQNTGELILVRPLQCEGSCFFCESVIL
jgi:hypothetical protein